MFARMKGLYEVRVRDQDAKVGEVKVFLIPGNPGERSLMVDAGFGTRECYEKLKRELEKLGIACSQLDLFITHRHHDHTGMAGTFEGTCGSVVGACALAGLKESTANFEKPDSKMKTYALGKEIIRGFKEKNQTISCHELKGIETKKVICSCPDCVRDAARLAEEIVLKKED